MFVGSRNTVSGLAWAVLADESFSRRFQRAHTRTHYCTKFACEALDLKYKLFSPPEIRYCAIDSPSHKLRCVVKIIASKSKNIYIYMNI